MARSAGPSTVAYRIQGCETEIARLRSRAGGGQEKCEDSHKPRSGQADAGRREGKKFYGFGRTSELILPASDKDLPSRFLIQQALCLLPMQHFNFSCNQDSSRQYGVWCGMRSRPVRELRVRSNAK
jgi:hypothetical protein